MGCTVSSHIRSSSGNTGDNNAVEFNQTPDNPARRVWKNQPLKIPSRCAIADIESLSQLISKREMFWSTRIGGDVLMWQTLRAASEAILESNLEFAQTLITASNISLPNGSLGVAYDERGYEYTIPPYCYSVPSNVTSDKHIEVKSVTEKLQDDEVVSVPGKSLAVKVRIYPGDFKIDLIECLTVNDCVLTLKRRIYDMSVSSRIPASAVESNGADPAETTSVTSPGDSVNASSNNRTLPLCEMSRQRIIFLGRELKDNQILNSLNITPDKVVQVYLRTVPSV